MAICGSGLPDVRQTGPAKLSTAPIDLRTSVAELGFYRALAGKIASSLSCPNEGSGPVPAAAHPLLSQLKAPWMPVLFLIEARCGQRHAGAVQALISATAACPPSVESVRLGRACGRIEPCDQVQQPSWLGFRVQQQLLAGERGLDQRRAQGAERIRQDLARPPTHQRQ
jgi:hypothetical protein